MKTTHPAQSIRTMLTLIYDGACPFCNHYVLKQQIEATYGPLILLDARCDDPRLMPYWLQGYPLDEGMLLDHDGDIFFGDAALAALAALSQRTGPFARINHFFAKPRISRALYPAFKALRRIALWSRRIGPLRQPPMTEAMKHKAG